MTIVKSNLCPTCGGLLNIDIDKQMYVCSFCGVSFDYEYFREDNVKEVASKAVLRNEYGSAKDAYDFMLAKDPHDFEALRGLFLCKTRWTDMKQMFNDSEVDVSPDEPSLLNAIDKCLPEHKAYFEKVREALEELYHYRGLTAKAKSIEKKKTTAEKELSKLKSEYDYNARGFSDLCEEVWNADANTFRFIVTFTVIVPLGLLIYALLEKLWWLLVIMGILAVAIIGGYYLDKFFTAKTLTSRMVPFEKEIAELAEQYKAKDAEAEESISRYKGLVQEFMDMDPLLSKTTTD